MSTNNSVSIVDDLLAFIRRSPTPQHCVKEASNRLKDGYFEPLAMEDKWTLRAGLGYFIVRSGTLIAFRLGTTAPALRGFRVLGAHTDSPNLRIKPRPDFQAHGFGQLGVESYGGLLDYTWLDRDLGLAGSVVVQKRSANSLIETQLVYIDRPILRIPSLAIHLQRDIREKGLKLNPQEHLAPIWELNPADKPKDAKDEIGALRRLLAHELKVDAENILNWNLSLMDLQPPTIGGLQQELIFSPRLDNQAMCHAALLALLRADPSAATQVVCLYDHEEVGSESASGAGSSLLRESLRRICEVEGPDASAGSLPRAIARSWQISADMAHAVHPHFAKKHEPLHLPMINGGPVIKFNAQQRYATDAESAGMFESLCREVEVPYQKFVNRGDLACGSTIGPISAAKTGIRTVDVGNAMLSMHSIRETAGAKDPASMVTVMRKFLVHEVL